MMEVESFYDKSTNYFSLIQLDKWPHSFSFWSLYFYSCLRIRLKEWNLIEIKSIIICNYSGLDLNQKMGCFSWGSFMNPSYKNKTDFLINLPFFPLESCGDFIVFSNFPCSSKSFSFIPKSFLFLSFHKNSNLLAKGCMLIREIRGNQSLTLMNCPC